MLYLSPTGYKKSLRASLRTSPAYNSSKARVRLSLILNRVCSRVCLISTVIVYRLPAKEVCMRAGLKEQQRELVVILLPRHQPVRVNVALPLTFMVAP